jgi:uncharacterized protein involved in exopolysaccharide biosynthesis
MGEQPREEKRTERPEIFWILFLMVSAGVFIAVLEPARREAAAARRHLEDIGEKLDARREHIQALRRQRQALEKGDPEAMRAAISAAGLNQPGARELPAPGRKGRGR